MNRCEDGAWHAGNGWGVQVARVHVVKGEETVVWSHLTDRAIWWSRDRAEGYLTGCRHAMETKQVECGACGRVRPPNRLKLRLVNPQGVVVGSDG